MLTQEFLKEKYNYNKKTGILTFRKNNKIVGSVDGEYIRTSINKKTHRTHRLIWQWVTGDIPNKIDHIDGVGTNNKWDNLRNVNHGENMKNMKKFKHNKTGQLGVSWYKKRDLWRAVIGVNKKVKHLGYFESFSDAVDARKNAEVLYGFHENHGRLK